MTSGMLQSMVSQRVARDLVAEQQPPPRYYKGLAVNSKPTKWFSRHTQ